MWPVLPARWELARVRVRSGQRNSGNGDDSRGAAARVRRSCLWERARAIMQKFAAKVQWWRTAAANQGRGQGVSVRERRRVIGSGNGTEDEGTRGTKTRCNHVLGVDWSLCAWRHVSRCDARQRVICDLRGGPSQLIRRGCWTLSMLSSRGFGRYMLTLVRR
ncbi:hypothetical protein BC567DRAFT_234288 [Phyllosticta citribraziliensis]